MSFRWEKCRMMSWVQQVEGPSVKRQTWELAGDKVTFALLWIPWAFMVTMQCLRDYQHLLWRQHVAFPSNISQYSLGEREIAGHKNRKHADIALWLQLSSDSMNITIASRGHTVCHNDNGINILETMHFPLLGILAGIIWGKNVTGGREKRKMW